MLVVDRAKVAAIDPDSHQVTFTARRTSATASSRARSSTRRRSATSPATRSPRSSSAPTSPTAEPLNAGGLDQALYAPLGAALSPGNGRLFAIEPTGEPGGRRDPARHDVYVAGWPFKVGILQAEVLPLVGEGVTGVPVIGDVPCRRRRRGARRDHPGRRPALPDRPRRHVVLRAANGKDIALPTYGRRGGRPALLRRVRAPGVRDAGRQAELPGARRRASCARSTSSCPSTRAAATTWPPGTLTTRAVAPGWPAPVNDLQFLTGPALADIDAAPGQEVFEGTASDDLQGLTGAGTAIDANWPKLTGDWTVTIPAIGTWGERRHKVLVSGTRSGRLMAYDTGAGPVRGRRLAAVPPRPGQLGRRPPRRGRARPPEDAAVAGERR